MRNLLLILLGLYTCIGFSQEYLLADEGSDKTMVADFIEKSISEKKLKRNPVLVINDRVVEKTELNQLNFYKSDILSISIMAMNQDQMADIYGKQSLNGVLLIDTKPFKERAVKNILDSNILYLLEGKKITRAQLEELSPDKIKSVDVIKNEKEMLKYTTEKVDGVVVVKMKR